MVQTASKARSDPISGSLGHEKMSEDAKTDEITFEDHMRSLKPQKYAEDSDFKAS